jgi:hypothetical protein
MQHSRMAGAGLFAKRRGLSQLTIRITGASWTAAWQPGKSGASEGLSFLRLIQIMGGRSAMGGKKGIRTGIIG